MGVPKFYRWVSERYPCLSEIVKEHQIPEFDNLYFDMNGIIHTCSHPNDDDPHFRISEEQIFQDIFHYIEVLFRIIRPKKLFFMAVDGVAPRAKMNQQRGRRFMSAFGAMQLAEQAKKRGETLPTEERFDSNCITPGTVFMTKLHEQLKYFVRMKITTDEMWRGIKIYLSGHNVPGEGEHKIMDFIRYSRSQSGYDPNTRHCLYGLDADLIMLGMSSHEPHFSLLREEVKFVRPTKNQKGRIVNPDQTTFHLLHLSLFREYLDFEFSHLKDKLPFGYDLEKIIDDWVFMGFLVGNDFIPHLPHLHIHEAALPRVYDVYANVLPTLDGYINESGRLNLPRFEKFMDALAQLDRDRFGDEYEDAQYFEGKSRQEINMTDIRTLKSRNGKVWKSMRVAEKKKKLQKFVDFDDVDDDVIASEIEPNASSSAATVVDDDDEDDDELGEGMNEELKKLIKRTAKMIDSPSSSDDEKQPEVTEDANASDQESPKNDDSSLRNVYLEDLDDEGWTPVMEREFTAHKKNYYKEKLDYCKVTKDVLHEQAVKYVTAIQWNLYYYYDGCVSWSWYYPHHYSPYLSDVRGFSGLDLKFNLSEPFLPFQQLLAVLPAASRKLLPPAFQDLMTKADSAVIDFYPAEFQTDLNGKKNEWEAVVLIPFIDEERLLNAMKPLLNSLTEDERRRNSHGNHLLFTTAKQSLGVYPSSLPGVFSDIINNYAACEEVEPNKFRLDRDKDKIVRGLLPNVKLDVYFPGFPTFKHIPVDFELKRVDVKVFQANSKNDSIVLTIKGRGEEFESDVNVLGNRIVDKEIYVNWPYLTQSLVVGVTTKDTKIISETNKSGEKSVKHATPTSIEKKQFDKDAESIKCRYFQNRAVDIGDVNVVLQVKHLLGRKFVCSSQGQVTLEKQWSDNCSTYALQTVVEKIKVHDASSDHYSSLEELYPSGAEVFLLGNPFYGHRGVVQKSELQNKKMHVRLDVPVEPDFSYIFEKEYKLKLYWYVAGVVSQKLCISPHFLSRITGTVYMEESRSSSTSNDSASSSTPAANNHNRNGQTRPNRYHIGLNLKFSKKNEEVPDYTHKDKEGVWWYSSNVLRILEEYYAKFPEIFNHMHEVSCSDDVFYADEIWHPNESKTKLKELSEFLKSLPCHNAQHQTAGTDTVDERMIRAIENIVEETKKENLQLKYKTVAVNPKVLLRPCLSNGNVPPDSKVDYQLYDRVVNVREGFTVPIGLRGTVIGVHVGHSESDLKLDVIFDHEFMGGLLLRGTKRSGYRVPAYALINLTYGSKRMETLRHRQQQKQHVHAKQRDAKQQTIVTPRNSYAAATTTNVVSTSLPTGQTFEPHQFVAQFAQPMTTPAPAPVTTSKSWVPKELPPNPLAPHPSKKSKSNTIDLSKLPTPQPPQIAPTPKEKKTWIPDQLPPAGPPVALPGEQKFNPAEFVAKFAQPACLIPPRTVESLPVDPRSAFKQVAQANASRSSKTTPSFVLYDANKKQDRQMMWNNLSGRNVPPFDQQTFPVPPPPPPPPFFEQVVQMRPPMNGPQVPIQWLSNSNLPFNRQQQQWFATPGFMPHNFQPNAMPPPGNSRPVVNVNSHNLFVPLQVTKKQPTPAYVKVNKQQRDENFANVATSAQSATNKFDGVGPQAAPATAEAFRPIQEVLTDESDQNKSVRPKSVNSNRTCRLAAKFTS